MDKYDAIETYQCRIEISNLIQTICHLQDDNKQEVVAAVETNKQAYMFDKSPYQPNVGSLEAFKAHIKVSEAHNFAVGYDPVLAADSLKDEEEHRIR